MSFVRIGWAALASGDKRLLGLMSRTLFVTLRLSSSNSMADSILKKRT
jgi:hypothetical protein